MPKFTIIMKRFILPLLCTLSITTLVNAQSVDPYTPQQPQQQSRLPKDSATKRAVRQLKTLERQLNLNEDQVLQLQVILVNRDIVMDSLFHNPTGDPRTDGRARRSVQQDADQKIDAILTDDQKNLYQQWKQQQKQKALEKKQQNQRNNPVNNNGQNNPQ
jgi:periplasmic protein CpxP/Spy